MHTYIQYIHNRVFFCNGENESCHCSVAMLLNVRIMVRSASRARVSTIAFRVRTNDGFVSRVGANLYLDDFPRSWVKGHKCRTHSILAVKVVLLSYYCMLSRTMLQVWRYYMCGLTSALLCRGFEGTDYCLELAQQVCDKLPHLL